MPEKRFTVVVPCYNERGAIRGTIDAIRAHLQGRDDYELLVVNDGSDDGSEQELARAEQEVPGLRVAHHRVNRGYGAALKTGVRRSKTEFVVITDADGTYPNHRIPDLVDKCEQADMIIGARTGGEVRYSLLRSIPKAFLRTYATWLVGEPIPDMNSGLRVFRRGIAARFLRILPDSFSFTTTITMAMMRNGYRVVFEPIDYAPRIGKSKIKPFRDTVRFMQLIMRTGMYFGPLRVLLPLAAVLFLLFAASLAYDVYRWNLTDTTVLLLMTGLNVAMFALLADMIDKRSVS